jgi:hypothetical protein
MWRYSASFITNTTNSTTQEALAWMLGAQCRHVFTAFPMTENAKERDMNYSPQK